MATDTHPGNSPYPVQWSGSGRWIVDPGAIPGEAFSFLDGDSETSVAAMVEVQSPDKPASFEVRGPGGVLISTADFPEEAARKADAHFPLPAGELGFNEHEVAYAYPGSPAAKRHGFARQGCYMLRIGRTEEAFATLKQALQQVKERGTHPGRWSVDHPLNAPKPVEHRRPSAPAAVVAAAPASAGPVVGVVVKNDKEAIETAKADGYTVHPANDETQGWAYCLEGDYSDEYPTEDLAWAAAVEAHALQQQVALHAQIHERR